MAWKLMYLEARDAAGMSEAAREAERRAMYARPDALPLPDEPPARKSWLAAILLRRASPAAPAASTAPAAPKRSVATRG